MLLTLIGRLVLPLIGPNLRKEYLGFFGSSCSLEEDYVREVREGQRHKRGLWITTGESSSSSSVALNDEPSENHLVRYSSNSKSRLIRDDDARVEGIEFRA